MQEVDAKHRSYKVHPHNTKRELHASHTVLTLENSPIPLRLLYHTILRPWLMNVLDTLLWYTSLKYAMGCDVGCNTI